MDTATLVPSPVLIARIVGGVGGVAAGAAAGAALGGVARLWMRLLADDPAFTWSGTIAVVAVFAAAGAGHAVATLARRAARRRWSTIGRVAGAALSLGLFAAAGAIMLPTVAAAALTAWRRDWPRWARALGAVVATPVPVMIAGEAVGAGLSPVRGLGLMLFVASYGAVAWAARPVVAPLGDGWRLGRWGRGAATVVALAAVTAALFLIVGVLFTAPA